MWVLFSDFVYEDLKKKHIQLRSYKVYNFKWFVNEGLLSILFWIQGTELTKGISHWPQNKYE